MSVVKVNHPDPTKGCKERTLYSENRFVTRPNNPALRKSNVAFTNARDLLKSAVTEAANHRGQFKVAAWAFVNGTPVDAIGFICVTDKTVHFTPLGYHEAKLTGRDLYDVARELTDGLGKDAPMLLASRERCSFPLRPEEFSGEVGERVHRLLESVLFKATCSMSELYDWAV